MLVIRWYQYILVTNFLYSQIRLQAKAMKKPYEVQDDFDKFLHKLRSEENMDLDYKASQSSSATTTEFYPSEEVEHYE